MKKADAAPRKRQARLAKPFGLAPTVSRPDLRDADGVRDTRIRQLLYDVATAANHLEAARAHLASRMEVTSPQYNMVMVIAQHGGELGISVSDLASRLHVSNTFVTSEIKKLMRAGLVTKEPNPADARGVLLRLTPEGQERVRDLEPELLFVNDHLFRHLSKSDFEHLSRIVASLIDDFSHTVALLGALKPGDAERGSALALRSFEQSR